MNFLHASQNDSMAMVSQLASGMLQCGPSWADVDFRAVGLGVWHMSPLENPEIHEAFISRKY